MTFGSHLRATIFQAERPLSIKACWFKRNIPVTSPPPPSPVFIDTHPYLSLVIVSHWIPSSGNNFTSGGGGMLLYDNIQLTSHHGSVNHVIPSKILCPPSPGDQ